MEAQNFDIREEYYSNVHSMKPKWWMKWGVLSVFIVIAVVFFLAYIVEYPDVVKVEVRTTTSQPSITLPIIQESEVEKILINNGDRVSSGTNLLVLKNNASYEDVFLLEKALKKFSFEKKFMVNFFQHFLNKNLQLGNVIENEWIAFSGELLAYYKVVHLHTYQSQIEFLRDELAKQYQLQRQYEQLIFSDKKQKALLENKVQADSVLFMKGIESKLQYENNKQYYYGKLSELKQNNFALNKIKLEIVRLENAIKNYKNNETESLVTQQLGIQKSYTKLKSSIATWKRNFVLTSTITGKVSFIQNLEENKYYSGKAIAVLSGDKKFYANINIPVTGAGKIKEGQRVIIKLNDYPYKEYGNIEGRLASFSSVSKDNFYIGKVVLTGSELSRAAKKIKLKENMLGVGEIVTKDRNVLERVFETILYIFIKDKNYNNID